MSPLGSTTISLPSDQNIRPGGGGGQRSQTIDERRPSVGMRGQSAGQGQQDWGPNKNGGDDYDYAPPRATGLYSQQNHSSPTLVSDSRPHSGSHYLSQSNSGAMDDINVGLESMRFSQRSSTPTASSSLSGNGGVGRGSLSQQGGGGGGGGPLMERRHSPNDLGNLNFPGGSDGAMEITGGRNGVTASVYSLEEASNNLNSSGGTVRRPERRESEPVMNHNRPGPSYDDQRRDSNHSNSGDPSFNSGDGRRDSGSSFLPYDDPYQQPSQQQQQQQYSQQPQQQQYNNDNYSQPQSSSSSQYYSESSYNSQQNQQQQQNSNQNQYYSQQQFQQQQQYQQQQQQQQHYQEQQYQQQPSFQPQPPHGGWNYDNSQAAAQNPYYVAAQSGFSDQNGYHQQQQYHQQQLLQQQQQQHGLRRATSNASSLGSMGGPSLGRSGTTMGPQGRKSSTNGGGGSTHSKSGPPITKSSVDEYRSRIKADPDPEAQFNFAKYLIEAAKKISSSASGDEKSAKKYRDALLAESLKLIKRLATQGTGLGKPAYADAQFFLANCLGNGSLGLQVDHEKAYNLYVQASKQNHSSATYRTAVCNEVGAGTRRDHARAVLFYRKASALGDTAGMYKLGMVLLNGLLGQQRNAKDAVAWLKRAASQADEDNPHALHELGLLYERAPPQSGGQATSGGLLASLVPYDPAQARELFTQAGQFGYPPSQFKLGTCYEYGSLTCPVDPRRSIAWYTRAAERGDAESELALSGWYLTGSEGVLKQSDSEAYLWARRAANKGLPKAEYAVGYYSEVGIGVKQDLEEAKRWYMRAAAQGNKRAMQRLTELKKLAETKGRGDGGKRARPTRQEASKECIIS